MRIIKIIMSISLVLVSFHLFSQGIFNDKNASDLTQIQQDLLREFTMDKIQTAEIFEFDALYLGSQSIQFEYAGRDLSFIGDRVNIVDEDQFSWKGTNDQLDARINLFFLDGKCSGEMHIGLTAYEIQDLNDNTTLIYEAPNYEIEMDDEVEVPDGGAQSESPESSFEAAGEGECKVRILVAYTNQANVPGRNFHNTAANRIVNMNTQLNRSNIAHDVELVRVVHLNYDEPTSVPGTNGCTSIQCEALYELRLNATLIAQRNLYDADVVMVVLNQGSGIAFLNPGAEWAFGTISWNNFASTTSKTFSHEVGHIYGCRHNTEEDSANDSTHGYNAQLDIGESWRTILSYPSGCGTCNRIDNFSNPDVDHLGDPTGPDPAVHDCAGEIDDSASDVADFRTSENAKILTADNLNNTDDFAYVYGHQTLTTSGNYTVGNGAVAELRATNHVAFNNGFRVNTGGQLKIFLGSCGNNIPGVIAEVEERENELAAGTLEKTELTLSPNPMTSEANIEFNILKGQNVHLSISNMEGKRVQTLLNGNRLEAGSHNYKLTNTSSMQGMYLCTLALEDEIIQKKFIVLY